MGASSTILFAGGGTGGHLFPGIAVAQELHRQDNSLRMVFVGSDRAIEATIANQYQLEHQNLPVESLSTLKKNPWQFIRRNWQAWRDASRLIQEIRPSAVIGLGGFASAPLIWEAKRYQIPIVLLEQNVIPGKTTRWLSRLADSVCVSFDETSSHLKQARHIVVTGNPVRQEISMLCQHDPIDDDQNHGSGSPLQLLILGGSQGADSLNAAVISAIQQRKELLTGWTFVHQTGPRDMMSVRQAYDQLGLKAEVEPFFHDLASRLPKATLVISRAGATTLAELACAGLPMILLPYPNAADHHQQANAQIFVNHGAAFMVAHAKSPEQTASDLKQELEQLIGNNLQRRTMGLAARQLARPDATVQIANLISGLIVQTKKRSV